mmetsp:Transcript_7035/g.19842  ORF Transcript_7035/g.19842 Transcript_7035/m.19842 type:complete len:399 (+) Transcript_7035:517-1713(+)
MSTAAVGTPCATCDRPLGRGSARTAAESQSAVSPGRSVGCWALSGWQLVEKLGEGGFGTVYRAMHEPSGQRAAVKVIRYDDVSQGAVRTELAIMRRISTNLAANKHLIHLLDVFQDNSRLYLVMELCQGPSLSHLLTVGGAMKESLVANIVREIASGLAALHREGILHRDLKPANIIWRKACGSSPLQLCDFGLGFQGDGRHQEADRTCGPLGTESYIAPEVFDNHQYSPACDIWALGILTYELLCGDVPFTNPMQVRLSPLLMTGLAWQHVSSEAKEFVSHVLQRNPSNRPTAEQVLKVPWVSNSRRQQWDRASSDPLPLPGTAARPLPSESTPKKRQPPPAACEDGVGSASYRAAASLQQDGTTTMRSPGSLAGRWQRLASRQAELLQRLEDLELR